MSGSTRWLIAVAAIIGAAVVVSVLVAALAGGEEEFPDGSPEAAVQSYLRAIADRDATAALAFLSTGLTERCGEIPREAVVQRGDNRFRATLTETTVRDDTTQVEVEITEIYGSDPFGGNEYGFEQVFVLVQENGEWRFDEAPWPLYCPGPVTVPAPIR